MQIGQPTDVKHVAHIGWEGPSSTTPSWMNDYKSPEDEAKGSSNKKPASSGERQKNKGRRKSSASTNSPAESPARPRRSTGKQREKDTGSGLDIPQQNDQSVVQKSSRQKKSKGTTAARGGGGEPPLPVAPVESKETDISVRAVYPRVGIESST
ncbi:CRIB domain-containing protein RIC5-like [Raphanus sativus]|uniref:CRIB domain-containing protein RIC5-like n=1 Tax=Raphanus sativus TaxID=3726 RepID=A0A6J0P326_RAPSA|nr:CRIB domain-containing protein RIC5-like [Raphanus sativus]